MMNTQAIRSARPPYGKRCLAQTLARACSARNAVRAALAAVPSAATLLASGSLYAGPQQGTVTAGNASISSTPAGHTQIDQTSAQAIINWGSFSVAQGESVTFSQPSSTSATLNRVMGGSKSVIDGILSANGQVLILNSAGVLFGRDAQVNVGSLLATTSDISDLDFLNGKLSFRAPGTAVGEVANEGTIRVSDAGLAALVAPTVRNSGLIQARLGRIALASGETFTVDLYGDHLINFAVGQTAGANSSRAVDQSGTLIADGGKVLISSDSAAGVISNVINLSGVTQAHSVGVSQAGEIILEAPRSDVTVSGTLDVTNASSGSGGILDLQSASLLTTAGSRLDASAITDGDGGSIKLWGTDTLAVAGGVSARGGAHSGRGGDLDLSTSGGMSVTGNIDLTALNGPSGSLLLDPASITVAATGSADPTASTVGAGFLNHQLQSGTNVTLSATDSITVDAAIDGRPVGGVTSSHPSGSVSLTAGSLTIGAPIVTDRAAITLTATGTTAGSGNIGFTGSAGTTPSSGFLWVADCSAACTAATVGTAPVALSAGGNVTSDAATASTGQIATLGTVAITSGGNVSGLPALNGITASGGTASGIGALTINATGTASLDGAKSNGAINITAAGITTGGSTLYSGTGGVTLNAGSGGITVNAAQGGSSGVQSANGGDVLFLTTGAVNVGSNVVAAGNLCVAGAAATCGAGSGASAGKITATGETLQAGSATGSQNITLASSDSISASTLLLGSQGMANLTAAKGVSVTNPITGYTGTGSIGKLSVTAGGDVALNGANVGISPTNAPAAGAGTASITSGGNISLTGSPLVARDGISINLTGATSGLTVNTSSSAGAGLVAGFGVTSGNAVDLTNVLNGSASISVTRAATLPQFTGPIVLESGLLAAGSVNLGTSSARVGTICGDAACASDAATIQAGAGKASTASIAAYASGRVAASRLLVGETGGVTLDSAGTVTVSQALSGFAGSLGIGKLVATSGQDLTLAGGTIGDSSSTMAGQGIATLTATGQFTTGGHSLIARDGISVAAGSGVTLNSVASGAALVAGYDGSGAYDAIAGHIPKVQIDGTSGTAPPPVNAGGGILSAGDVLIGSQHRVGQLTSAAGTIQAGDPVNNAAATLGVYSNGSVEFGPVLVGPQGSVSVNPTDTSSSTSGSVTFDRGLYGFSSGGTQLGIGSLTVDSRGTISIPGVQANGNITITGYTPAATVHGGYITTAGDVTAQNGRGPWTAGGNVNVTLASGNLTFNLPQSNSFDLASASGAIDIEGAGDVSIPNGISAGKSIKIGATQSVGQIELGPVRSETTGLQDPNILTATGPVSLGAWMGGQDEVNTLGGFQVRNDPIAGGVSVTGSTITTAGIGGFETAQETCCYGVSYITLNGSQGVTVNGSLTTYGVDAATGAGIALYAGPGKTIAVNQSLTTMPESYLNPGGLSTTPLGSGGTIVIGDRNGYPANPQTVAPVKIDLSADLSTVGRDITFNGDVTLFVGLAQNHAAAVNSPFWAGFTSTNPSSDPTDFPDSNFVHITDLLVDPQGTILARPTEADLGTFFTSVPQRAQPGADRAGWNKNLGALTSVIDANPGSGPGGGNVTFNGSVVRDLPSTLPTAPGAVTTDTPDPVHGTCTVQACINELTVLPSYVNVHLIVRGNSVTFNGATGDPDTTLNSVLGNHSDVDQAGNPIGFVVNASTNGLPALGYFKIDASGVNSATGAFNGWSCANASLCSHSVTYDPGLVSPVNQPFTAGTTPNVQYFYYQFNDTNQGQQDIGLNPTSVTSTIPGTVTNVTSTGAFAANPLQPNAAVGGNPSASTAGAGIAGLNAGVLGGANLSVTSTTAVTEVDGSTTADSRRQENSGTQEKASDTTTDPCPRGAGSTADLGLQPGVNGASPNVFARCGHASGAQQAATP